MHTDSSPTVEFARLGAPLSSQNRKEADVDKGHAGLQRALDIENHHFGPVQNYRAEMWAVRRWRRLRQYVNAGKGGPNE